MARGDVKFFAASELLSKTGTSFNYSSDTFKLGLVTNATVPTVSTAVPRWGAGGTTNFATNEIATATSYTGPVTLASVTFARSSGVITFDAADPSVIAQDAGGATDAYYGIIYDDTVSGDPCIAFIDLGGPVSLVAGSLTITFNASGIGTITCS